MTTSVPDTEDIIQDTYVKAHEKLESFRGDSSLKTSKGQRDGGPMFPLFAKMIPSFDDVFDQFAADLKKEAESRK